MIYNFNLGIGWASSGVEYAQSYRAAILRNIGADARFIFTDMITAENIQHLTKNIGFLDSEIIWLYMFFTDQRIAPVSYTLNDLKKTLATDDYTYTRNGKTGRIIFQGTNNFYSVYFTDEKSDRVHRVEIVSGGLLIRKDYFTYATGCFRNIMRPWTTRPICICGVFLMRTAQRPMRRSMMTEG